MSQRSLLSILVVGLLLFVSLLGWQLEQSRQAAIERASSDAANLAYALDGQLTATLRRIESNLNHIAGQLPRAALQPAARAAHADRVQAILRPFLRDFPEVTGYYVWHANGDLLYRTSPMTATKGLPSIAARAGYQQLRADPDLKMAFSDAIRSSITGLQTVAVYVPVRDATGRLLAVLTATLNLERFTQTFESLQAPAGSVIFVRRSDDHKMVIRYPHRESEINKPVRNAISQRIDAGERSGRDRFQAVTDGVRRIYGFRKLEGYPFYLVVGLSEDGALASWYRHAGIVAGALLALGLFLVAVIWRVGRLERQRLAAQREAAQAQELLHDALDSISSGIVIFDREDRLVMSNRAMRDIYRGIEDLIVPGRTFEEITRAGVERGVLVGKPGQQDEWLRERIRLHRVADGQAHELELGNGHWIQFSEFRTQGGYTVGSRIDITERKRLEQELLRQATTDALTGLPNRRQFMHRLEEELERVRRKTTTEACVLMLDLDHFKRINDQHGHAAGDQLLRHFGELLRQELRVTDTAARIGGEEFAVILPGAGMEAGRGFAQRVIERLASRPLNVGSQQIQVTVSIGIATIDASDLTAGTVLSRADAARGAGATRSCWQASGSRPGDGRGRRIAEEALGFFRAVVSSAMPRRRPSSCRWHSRSSAAMPGTCKPWGCPCTGAICRLRRRTPSERQLGLTAGHSGRDTGSLAPTRVDRRGSLMDSINPLAPNPEVNGLITAIARNTEDGVLAKHLGAQSWYIVADYLHPHEYERGHLLIGQGGSDRNLFFLESGNLKVDVKTDQGLLQLAILGPGTVVGEGSFFSHLPRTASVVAYSRCKVWEMSPADFDKLGDKHPAVALSLAKALAAILATRMLDVSKRIAIT